MKSGDWLWSEEHRQLCKVVETQTLWGNTFHRVWLPTQDAVVRIRSNSLKPLTEAGLTSAPDIAYIALPPVSPMLLAKMFCSPRLNFQLFPCPTKSRHSQKQYRAIRLRDSYASRIRYLLVDEVGLGKTIEAGLILRELKLRGLVRRILVVASKGLVT